MDVWKERLPRMAERVRAEVEARPLAAVIASLCVGFALGGGVTRGLMTLLLGVGARAAGSKLSDSILERAPRYAAAQEDQT